MTRWAWFWRRTVRRSDAGVLPAVVSRRASATTSLFGMACCPPWQDACLRSRCADRAPATRAGGRGGTFWTLPGRLDHVSRRDTPPRVHRGDRQARWLHTRISEHLEDALKREARRRRLPVSLLVRNVLEGALDLVGDIVEGSLHVARRSEGIARAATRGRDAAGNDVYGWQELILNRAAACARCAATLGAGATAYRGLRDGAGPPVFQCVACVGRLRRRAAEEKESTS